MLASSQKATSGLNYFTDDFFDYAGSFSDDNDSSMVDVIQGVSLDVSLDDLVGECLRPGQKLIAGQYLVSPSRNSVAMLMKDTGDLCLFTVRDEATSSLLFQNPKTWTQRWCLSISTLDPGYLEVTEEEGLMQFVSNSGEVYWQAANAAGNSGMLAMQDDFNFVLYSFGTDSYVPMWACNGMGPDGYIDENGMNLCPYRYDVYPPVSGAKCNAVDVTSLGTWQGDCLDTNKQLKVGDYLTNEDRTQALQLQSNGDICTFATHYDYSPFYNLTDHNQWSVSWCAGATVNNPSHLFVNGARGTVELVSTDGYTYWQSAQPISSNGNNFFLQLQNDANLVLYKTNRYIPVWACGGGSYGYVYYENYNAASSFSCDLSYSAVNTEVCDCMSTSVPVPIWNDDSTSGSTSTDVVTIGWLSAVFALGICLLFAIIGHWCYKVSEENRAKAIVKSENERNVPIHNEQTSVLPYILSSNVFDFEGSKCTTAHVLVPSAPPLDLESGELELVVITPSMVMPQLPVSVVEAHAL